MSESAVTFPLVPELYGASWNGSKPYTDIWAKAEAILATAAAHHRLVWIHPFIDGNGRVARLMSHATLLETLDSGAIWSVARGLARNVEDYKQKLANCDLERRNDLDGRGHLSEGALAQFTRFLLDTCLDQVSFMERLTDPERLKTRIVIWAEEEIRLGTLPTKAGNVLEALLYRGELQAKSATYWERRPVMPGESCRHWRLGTFLCQRGRGRRCG
jgi:Fic family protein